MQMIPTRIFFEKTGRAKYTSHLDTMRTMTRALKRSGLPFWYTQGFNPHLYNTFSLPIALGYESVCESVDVRLTQEIAHDIVLHQLNASLPPGLKAVKVAAPVMNASEIAWADYRVEIYCAKQRQAAIKNKWIAFLDEPVIEVVKKTKKGEKIIDIKPHAKLLTVESAENNIQAELRLASGNTLNINPTLFLDAFWRWSGEEAERVRILRTGIYNEKLEPFA